MEVTFLGAGRYEVSSESSPGKTYSVVDGICSCPGYEFRQKCKHVEELIMQGRLDPYQVEGYHLNQRYPPIKLANPSTEGDKFIFWIADFQNPYLADNYHDFMRIAIEPKPKGILLPFSVEANFDPAIPDIPVDGLEAEEWVAAYRQQLDAYGPKRFGVFMSNCRLQANGRKVVFLGNGSAVGHPLSFANPRRVFSSWWYEHTKQAVPEMKGA